MIELSMGAVSDLPLVPSIKLRTGSELVEGLRFVQDVNCAGTTRLKFALLYWICRRSDKRRVRARIKAVLVNRKTAVFVTRDRVRDS